MGRNRKWLQIAILAVVVVVGALTLANQLFFSDKKPTAGSGAPNFTLPGLDGNTYKLSDFRGKIVVVNFWGTFCEPCRDEMPAIQRQFEKWDNDKVVFLGVNLGENVVTVRNFINQYAITFPVLLDDTDEIRKRYGVRSYPTTFFIRPDGKVNEIFVGEMNDMIIERAIAAISL